MATEYEITDRHRAITTWKPYDGKRSRGRAARRWKDKLDDYWEDTIWQRIAQDRQIWKQHAEVFDQTTGFIGCTMPIMMMVMKSICMRVFLLLLYNHVISLCKVEIKN